MRQPRPLRAPTRACVSPLARWRESQPETVTEQGKYRSIFPFAVPYQKWGATNRAPAAAGKNTRTAAVALHKVLGPVVPACHSNRGRGISNCFEISRDVSTPLDMTRQDGLGTS